MRQIMQKEPWWASPPKPGQDESELEWGWLVIYSEGEPRFEFIKGTPIGRADPPAQGLPRHPRVRMSQPVTA